jgi:uncharacterized RDD family membrane protein YckC
MLSKRILTFGAMAMILAAALIAVLAVLDVITFGDAREALGDTMSVIVIVTGAVALMATVAALGKRA